MFLSVSAVLKKSGMSQMVMLNCYNLARVFQSIVDEHLPPARKLWQRSVRPKVRIMPAGPMHVELKSSIVRTSGGLKMSTFWTGAQIAGEDCDSSSRIRETDSRAFSPVGS